MERKHLLFKIWISEIGNTDVYKVPKALKSVDFLSKERLVYQGWKNTFPNEVKSK